MPRRPDLQPGKRAVWSTTERRGCTVWGRNRPLRVAVISWCSEHKLAATVVRRPGMTQDVFRVTLINQCDLYVSGPVSRSAMQRSSPLKSCDRGCSLYNVSLSLLSRRLRLWLNDARTYCGFYRAMHFSAKRGIAIACRLSVRPSVCLSVCL